MIKLIATDVDGTLVKESSKELPKEYIEMVRKLVDAGFLFCVSSGRQYSSIYKMFEAVDRELYYIAENGAHIVAGGETIYTVEMNQSDVQGIMTDLRTLYPEGCHVVASNPEGSFIESESEDFYKLITEQYRNHAVKVADILTARDDYVKLAIFKKGSIREIGNSFLIPKWQEKVKTCMAGEEWVDFMDASVDKGNALSILMKRLGVTYEETMVFGDNQNDIGMMKVAFHSYAVANAVDEVKQAARNVCGSYEELGVLKIWETLILQKKEELKNVL